MPTYGFIQDSRTSVAFNGDQIASVNHVTGQVISANIDDQGRALMTKQNNPMVEAAKAYYLASQYLLKANVEKPKK